MYWLSFNSWRSNKHAHAVSVKLRNLDTKWVLFCKDLRQTELTSLHYHGLQNYDVARICLNAINWKHAGFKWMRGVNLEVGRATWCWSGTPCMFLMIQWISLRPSGIYSVSKNNNHAKIGWSGALRVAAQVWVQLRYVTQSLLIHQTGATAF